jgi:uncharacterized protein
VRKPDWDAAKAYVLGRLEAELPPNLYYHGLHHTRDDVLPATQRLSKMVGLDDDQALLLHTAALYHDIGYIEKYTQNECIAVVIAEETLPRFGYNSVQIERIGEIILATQMPQTPSDFLQELICDSDLDSLGRDDFFTTSDWLLEELKAHGTQVELAEWYQIQVRFLSEHQYFTEAARSIRDGGKEKNLEQLKARLKALT